MRISLQTSSPKASFTGAIPAVKRATCSSSDSLKRFCKFLLGAYSELSDRIIRRSIGKLNSLRAFNCY